MQLQRGARGGAAGGRSSPPELGSSRRLVSAARRGVVIHPIVMTLARRSSALLALVALGCGDAGITATDGEGGDTVPPASSSGATTSGSTTAQPTTAGASAEGSDGTDSTGAPTTDAFKYDLPIPDVGGDSDGPGEPTCATIDEFPRSSLGCEFYAVDLPMSGYGNSLPYGVGVGNPGDAPVTVTIEDHRGPGGALREITSFEVAARASELVSITGPGGLLEGEDHSLEAVGLHPAAALRITADAPITAMQINPVGASAAHTTDASMLLPVNALDTAYIAVGYLSYIWMGNEGGDGDIVVVATEDATTVTTVEGDVMLDAFDAWQYRQGKDATGFFVAADRPVAVFSGTSLTFLPSDDSGDAADHLEEQVIPLSAWGTHYVAARHPQRMPVEVPEPEPVWWRVIAAEDGVAISVDPPQPNVGGVIDLANIGDFVEFASRDSFVVASDRRFMLVQYMAGAMIALGGDYQLLDMLDPVYGPDDAPIGDPYMAQVIPSEQWLTELTFVTDSQYPRDFVVISREAGTQVTLECLGVVPDDHFTAIPGTPYEVGHVDLDVAHMGGEGSCVDGQQYLTATAPVGVLVGGVDHSTSYGYPGGMGLSALWQPPQEPPG